SCRVAARLNPVVNQDVAVAQAGARGAVGALKLAGIRRVIEPGHITAKKDPVGCGERLISIGTRGHVPFKRRRGYGNASTKIVRGQHRGIRTRKLRRSRDVTK